MRSHASEQSTLRASPLRSTFECGPASEYPHTPPREINRKENEHGDKFYCGTFAVFTRDAVLAVDPHLVGAKARRRGVGGDRRPARCPGRRRTLSQDSAAEGRAGRDPGDRQRVTPGALFSYATLGRQRLSRAPGGRIHGPCGTDEPVTRALFCRG